MMMNDSINDYKIVGTLGEGAFGKVYKALGVDRKHYALKIIPINPKLKDKIRQEGRLLTSMQHINILWARQFFYYQQEKYFVIITQFCNQGGLDNYIGQIEPEMQVSIMKGISEGLLYLHRDREIIHRDLKPQNILLNDWVPKIADMGVAKMLKTYQVTTKIGTPIYMAYEMLEGDYSIEVDIWALGIIFLEIAAGKRIFQLLKGEEIPAKRPTFPSQQLLNQIPSEKMRKMIREMLQKNPKDRITIEQVLAYFDSNQLRVSKGRSTFQQQKKRKEGFAQSINDCHSKTQQFWFNKYQIQFIKQLYEKNMVEIVAEAEQGNKKALFILAKMYEQGFGMVQDANKSHQLLLKCYNLEEPHCCFELYLLSTSSTERFQYLMTGKQFQQVRCLFKIAENYLEGTEGVAVDYQEAEEIIESLCQLNYPPAYLLKGNLFSKKNTEYYNIDKMRDCYKKGSELGNISCKILLANELYRQKKYQQSLELSKKIEKQISLQVKDKLNLFQLEAKNYSKLRNTEKTVQFYYKCMELDDGSLERDYLGTIANYLQSIQEYTKAIDFYNEAIKRLKNRYKESTYFAQRLKYLCETLYTLYYERKKYKQAYGIAKLSAELNFQSGKADQAYMLYGGVGIEKSQKLGLQLLRKYAKQDNAEAISYLRDIQQQLKKQITK